MSSSPDARPMHVLPPATSMSGAQLEILLVLALLKLGGSMDVTPEELETTKGAKIRLDPAPAPDVPSRLSVVHASDDLILPGH